MTTIKLTQKERNRITTKVNKSGLTGMKGLEYAEYLAQKKQMAKYNKMRKK